MNAHRVKLVGIHTYIIPSKICLALLMVINFLVMLVPMKVNRTFKVIIPLCYRVMEKDKLLVLPNKFMIILYPTEYPGILLPLFIIQKIIMIPFDQELVTRSTGQNRKRFFRSFHGHVAQDKYIIFRSHNTVPIINYFFIHHLRILKGTIAVMNYFFMVKM